MSFTVLTKDAVMTNFSACSAMWSTGHGWSYLIEFNERYVNWPLGVRLYVRDLKDLNLEDEWKYSSSKYHKV